jgi:hypothetical protein
MEDVLVGVVAGVATALRADVNLLEVVLLLGVALAAKRGWMRWPAWFDRLEPVGRALARRRRTAVAGVIAVAVLARLALLPLVPVPHPGSAGDEFSHSLLGDTLASGRLTNPPHPLWVHLESRHVIHQPTYNSMYFPGQGAFLALGKVVFGHPWAGVLLSTALFCGALTWMLQGWISPGWALLGGLLAILRIGLVSYWANSFWGGSVTALGGALALGAWPRLRRPGLVPAVLLGVGLSLMAATRPFESLLFSMPLLVTLAVGVFRRKVPIGPCVVALAVVALTGVALAVYVRAVTGSPFLLPYQVNQRTYGWPMTLIWQDPPQVQHRHRELLNYFNWERAEHESLRSPRAALAALPFRGALLWSFYLGPALTLAVAMAWRSLGQVRVRLALLAGGATLAANLVEQSSYPHYVSPATCVVFLVIVNSFKWLMREKKASLHIPRAVLALSVLAVAFRLVAIPLGLPLRGPQRQTSWCCSRNWLNERWPFEQRLRATEGRHLVIVRYGPSDQTRADWVFNEADIDGAKIVWARDMGPERNAELVRYFSGRRLWLAQPDATPPSLHPCN